MIADTAQTLHQLSISNSPLGWPGLAALVLLGLLAWRLPEARVLILGLTVIDLLMETDTLAPIAGAMLDLGHHAQHVIDDAAAQL